MVNQLLRILIIDDSESDAVLMVTELQRCGIEVHSLRVDSEDSLTNALQEQAWDVVLSDYNMPLLSASAALTQVRAREQYPPFIIVSGAIGEEAVVDLIKQGANDYVMKEHLSRLYPIIKRVLQGVKECHARQQAEQALRLSEARWRSITESSADYILQLDQQGQIIWINHALPGLTQTDMVGMLVYDFLTEEARVALQSCCDRVWASFEPCQFELLFTNDEQDFYFDCGVSAIMDAENVIALVVSARDVTERHYKDKELHKILHALECSRNEILIADREGVIEYVNPAFTVITGYTADEAIGRKPGFQKSGEVPDSVYEEMWKTLAAGENWNGELCNKKKDGSLYWEDVTISPVVDANGQTRNFICIRTDISERHRLRQSVIESKQLLQSIMDNIPSVVYVKDPEGHFTFINRQFETLFNINREDIVGQSLHDVFPQDIADEMQRNDKAILETGRVLEYEENAPHADGLHNYSSIKFPLVDEDNNIVAVCGISTDITEQKKHEVLVNELAEAVSMHTGKDFFTSLATALGNTLNVAMVTIAVLDETCPGQLQSLVINNRGVIEENVQYPIAGTPCEIVLDEGPCTYTSGVQALFSDDHFLDKMNIESYCGTRLYNTDGDEVIGIMAIMDTVSFEEVTLLESILQIFASRVSAEIQRESVEDTLMSTEKAYSDLLENLPIGIYRSDLEGHLLTANDAMIRLFECQSLGELLALEASDFYVNLNDRKNLHAILLEKGFVSGFVYEFKSENGARKWLSLNARIVNDTNGAPLYIDGSVEDITERKIKQQNDIREAQKQRDALVREVHHRIKNNLQGIVGLLRQRAMKKPDIQSVLEEAISQVQAISIVHGFHGQEGQQNLSVYDMVSAIAIFSQGLFSGRIHVSQEDEQVNLVRVIETEAVPLALIMNELVLNALKHCLPDGKGERKVEVLISRTGDSVDLLFRNAAVELKAGFNFYEGAGLGVGLGLVKSLMPPSGTSFDFWHADGMVNVKLTLQSPVTVVNTV